MSLFQHILDAIKVNHRRKKLYAQLTAGDSKFISIRIIIAEILMLPFAFIAYILAKKWNTRRIDIIKNDFLPMKNLKEIDAPIKTCSRIDRSIEKEMVSLIARFRLETILSIRRGDINQVINDGLEFLGNIKTQEVKHLMLLPMLRHLMEGFLLSSTNAVIYAKQSNNRTAWFSKTILKAHMRLMPLSLRLLDFPANKFHVLAIGIIENDLPPIKIEGPSGN